MTVIAWMLLGGSLGLCAYAYVGYPMLLKVLGALRPFPGFARPSPPPPRPPGRVWPRITITVPVYNEAAVIAGTIERLLEIDYPAGRRQILVVSDASTDGTNDIVAGFAARGVELLCLRARHGKTAAENAARPYLTGDIIVNTDAAVRVHAQAVSRLVAAFDDPSVGVASGRDVSVANVDDRANPGEQAYVGYEMWVRALETRVQGIVGASGCLYAIRRDLHMAFTPEGLSRDFGAALVARAHGFRAVSVSDALCYVPRSVSLRREYGRKVRTMARGLRTLWRWRGLLDPSSHGLFAWMLFSHKLCRWLVPWATAAMAAALVWLAVAYGRAGAAAGLGGIGMLVAAVGWLWPKGGRRLPRVFRILGVPAYAVAAIVAGLHAWVRAVGGHGTAVWEPTRRGGGGTGAGVLPAAAPPQHDGGRAQHDPQVLER